MLRPVTLLAALMTGACSFPWDVFEPLEEEPVSTGTGGDVGDGGSGLGGAAMSGPAGPGGSGSGGGAGGMGGATSSAGGGPVADFFDDFDRLDGDELGNGWMERTPESFFLMGGAVHKLTGSSSFDNVVTRPLDELIADVETSVELQITSIGSIDEPMIAVRMQLLTLVQPGMLDSYRLEIPMSTALAYLTRTNGSTTAILSIIPLVPPLTGGETYRFRLRAEGSGPVTVQGAVDVATANGWTTLGSASFVDDSPEAHTGSGLVGFTSGPGSNHLFDNFRYSAL